MLTSHPRINDAAVVGLPDALWGEQLVAALVGQADSDDSLKSWCSERLADFKIPKRFQWFDSMPRNGLGKLSRDRIRTQLLFQMEMDR